MGRQIGEHPHRGKEEGGDRSFVEGKLVRGTKIPAGKQNLLLLLWWY